MFAFVTGDVHEHNAVQVSQSSVLAPEIVIKKDCLAILGNNRQYCALGGLKYDTSIINFLRLFQATFRNATLLRRQSLPVPTPDAN